MRQNRLEGFAPTYQGFKDVHGYIFQDVYEWAGKSRAERVTIDGQTFTPRPHGSFHKMQNGVPVASFAPSHHIETETPELMKVHRGELDRLKAAGELTPRSFGDLLAKMIGDMNFAHPFREGNGRAMRSFIDQLAPQYGMKVATHEFTKDAWINGSAAAMIGPGPNRLRCSLRATHSP